MSDHELQVNDEEEVFDEEVDDLTPEEPEAIDYEQIASGMGWRPLREYKGDKTRWVDAKEYVARKPLFDKLHEKNEKLSALEANVSALMDMVKTQYDAGYEAARADLEAAKKEAIASNDLESYVEVQEKIAKLDKDHQEKAPKPAPKQVEEAPVPQAFLDWREENLWYSENEVMAEAANKIAQSLQDKPEFQGNLEALLSEVTKQVSTKFSKSRYFGKSNRPVAPSVESGSRMTAPKTKSTYSLADLSPAEQEIAKGMLRSMPKGKDGKPLLNESDYVKSIVEKRSKR